MDLLMRIGHYMTGIWEPGGIASYIRRVSGEQVRLGHEVVYFDLEEARAQLSGNNVNYCSDESEMLRRAADLKVDVLHVHCLVSAAEKSTVPFIRTVHGHQPYCPSGSRYLKNRHRPCDRSFSFIGCTWGHVVDHCGSVRPANFVQDFRRTLVEMRTLKHRWITTVSQFMKDQMVRDGYNPALIHVLYLPAPPTKDAVPIEDAKPVRFVFLGRLTTQKGVEWALRSLARTADPVCLDIGGEGDLQEYLQRLTAELGLVNRVTFHGWVSQDRVQQLLRECRAVLFPSVWHEPGGTVAFEAMVNARPVIMSAVGGMPEVVKDGVNGLLVPPNDRTGLTQAMDLLAGDHGLATRLGNAGRELAAVNYTLQGHVLQLLDIYGRCIAASSVS
ncbi:MAG TPA: glycosyltransferase family 4 protein [Roseimicrobium sp.]|nr:glycosyltransferase family 4 protein [Roseimicrobium sp.]